MRRVYRWLSKKALWIVTGLSPVVIAACYGMESEFTHYSYNGRVVDRITGQGIEGIQVNCGGGVLGYSDPRGDFWLTPSATCPTRENVLFKDIDGAENGSYQDRTVPFLEVANAGIVELDPTVTP